MKFIADLHIHSKFSIATSKNLDFENLYIAAQLKGITVIGTGDFTHPGWFSEIREKLVPAEQGLFRLRQDIAKECDNKVPGSCRGEVRFLLVTEISNIYKINEKTRKNHNLVFMPDLECAEKFNARLEKIGNIKSDGRPILGLDSRNLLEIMLEISDQAFLVPAHIWTPWFSLFGSKSGFDSIYECFEDLSEHIFAVETGLSSDPAMNWRVSELDRMTLISNSDAHSPLKLGREANVLNTELSYPSIRAALKTGDPEKFLGTFEFYPEEGKYHLDGHRKCGMRLWPQKTIQNKGICPVCNKPVTKGVLYRVEELADRPKGEKPDKTHPFFSLIPLTEILSQILGVGPGTKKVSTHYYSLLEKFGPEFTILHSMETEPLKKSGIQLLGEAIKRMRGNQVEMSPGYDGEYGIVTLFTSEEKKQLVGQKMLFSGAEQSGEIDERSINRNQTPEHIPRHKPNHPTSIKNESEIKRLDRERSETPGVHFLNGLNIEQLKAVKHKDGPLLITAGPGTGKTRTLTCRITELILNRAVSPRNILAITFTNKAAREMNGRLEILLGTTSNLPLTTTFHSLCLKILQEKNKNKPLRVADENDQTFFMKEVIKMTSRKNSGETFNPNDIFENIITAKQNLIKPEEVNGERNGTVEISCEQNKFIEVYAAYQKFLKIQGLVDYEDLIFKTIQLFEKDANVLEKYQACFKYIFVDEYQDLNYIQYRLLRRLSLDGKNLFVIGDPDQSIYGFRGSDVKYFNRFMKDFPGSEKIILKKNYRSTQTILDAGFQIITTEEKGKSNRAKIYSGIKGLTTLGIIETASEKSEAVAVGKRIEKMIGGMGFYSVDFGKTGDRDGKDSYGFSDFAVLSRTGVQAELIYDVLTRAGLPCQVSIKKKDQKSRLLKRIGSLIRVNDGTGSYSDFANLLVMIENNITKTVLERFLGWGFDHNYSLSAALKNLKRLPVNGLKRNDQIKLIEFADTLISINKKTKNMTLEKQFNDLLDRSVITVTEEERFLFHEAVARAGECYNNRDLHGGHNINHPAMQLDTDIYEPKVEKVSIMTMHASKGLEFPVVFITGCEKGLIPLEKSKKTDNSINEERRLFYVAITRAGERLYLTYANKRRIYGRQEKREVSPFIGDIEDRLKKYKRSGMNKRKKKGPVQLELF